MPEPTPPFDIQDFASLAQHSYMAGFTKKARADLLRIARIYNGIKVRVFTLDETGTPCPDCIDTFTGQVVNQGCTTCNGTGYLAGYTEHDQTFAIAQLSPKVKTNTAMGDLEGNGRRDSFYLVGGPLLQDQDLIVAVDTGRVYKIVDQEPSISAIGGDVILQLISCAPLSKGAPEYRVLV